MLEKGDDEFSIFADDLDISWGLYGDGLILVAAFVESNYDLFVDVVSDC